jgi:hypothetical protein
MNRSSKRPCCNISAVVDPTVLLARMSVVMETRRHLADLQKLLEPRQPCYSRRAGEKAFQVEAHVRLAIAAGIETLNELADTGELEAMLNGAMAQVRKAPLDARALAERLVACRDLAVEHLGWEISSILDEAAELVARHQISIGALEDHLVYTVRDEQGERRVAVTAAPRAGQKARISLDDFFATPGSLGSVASVLEPDCHHRVQNPAPSTIPTGLYDLAIDGFAVVRETTYRFARELEAHGVPRFMGSGGAAAIGAGIIALIVIILALILGAVILKILCDKLDNQGLCLAADILGGFVGAGLLVLGGSALANGKGKLTSNPDGAVIHIDLE